MSSFYITLEIPADSLEDAHDIAAGIADYGEAIIVDVGPAEDIAEPEGGWCCQCGEAGHTDEDPHIKRVVGRRVIAQYAGKPRAVVTETDHEYCAERGQCWSANEPCVTEPTVACVRWGHHINPNTGRCNRCSTEG